MRRTARRCVAIDIALDPQLIERFARSVRGLWPPSERLAVAVSGGADSLALLLLAQALAAGRVEAATVDHALRPESRAEAEFVAELCARLNIPHEILPVEIAPGSNLQARARVARYRALGRWLERRGIGLIASAHHADDQAETLMMRLNRASGLPGLAAARRSAALPHFAPAMAQSAPRLIRPLLDWRKRELEHLVRQAGIAPVDDPSNRDLRFERAKIRAALDQADWIDRAALAQSASHLAEAAEALEWAIEREWNEAVIVSSERIVYRPCAPRAIRLEILRRAIDHLGKGARGSDTARLLDRLESGPGQAGNLGGVLVRSRGREWVFTREPSRR